MKFAKTLSYNLSFKHFIYEFFKFILKINFSEKVYNLSEKIYIQNLKITIWKGKNENIKEKIYTLKNSLFVNFLNRYEEILRSPKKFLKKLFINIFGYLKILFFSLKPKIKPEITYKISYINLQKLFKEVKL